MKTALQERLTAIGDPAEKDLVACTGADGEVAFDAESAAAGTATCQSGQGYAARPIGIAEAEFSTAENFYNSMTKNLETAQRWKTISEADEQAAEADLDRSWAILQSLVEDVAPLARAEVELREQVAAAEAEQAARVIAAEKLGECANGYKPDEITGAEEGLTCIRDDDVAVPNPDEPVTGARAVYAAALKAEQAVSAQQAFHDAREQWALDNLTPVRTRYNALVAAEAELKTQLDAAEERLAMAKTACKVAAFKMAQAAMEEANLIKQGRAAKIAEVQQAYAAKASFPDDGAVGTLCNIPKPVEGQAAEPRTECLEGEPGKPLCCGAAQRFLKDGTKLSIETCQLATATTYTYYPELPEDAVVEPTPETWRFQCISAAQSLAAAATAALAAGYMMA